MVMIMRVNQLIVSSCIFCVFIGDHYLSWRRMYHSPVRKTAHNMLSLQPMPLPTLTAQNTVTANKTERRRREGSGNSNRTVEQNSDDSDNLTAPTNAPNKETQHEVCHWLNYCFLCFPNSYVSISSSSLSSQKSMKDCFGCLWLIIVVFSGKLSKM